MSAADRTVIHPRIPTALKERVDRIAERRSIGVSAIVERGVEHEVTRLEALDVDETNGASS